VFLLFSFIIPDAPLPFYFTELLMNEITWSKNELEKIRVGDLEPTISIDVGDKILIKTNLQDILGVVQEINEDTNEVRLGKNTWWCENEIVRTLHHDAQTFTIENIFKVVPDAETDQSHCESQTHSKGSFEEKTDR
tara:strand:- start:439 stop:846 length:408 start_codon:yes stop_codon:yes gene_type:complete